MGCSTAMELITRGYWGKGARVLELDQWNILVEMETPGFNIKANQSHNFSGIMVVVHPKHLCNFKHCWLKPTPGILAESLGLLDSSWYQIREQPGNWLADHKLEFNMDILQKFNMEKKYSTRIQGPFQCKHRNQTWNLPLLCCRNGHHTQSITYFDHLWPIQVAVKVREHTNWLCTWVLQWQLQLENRNSLRPFSVGCCQWCVPFVFPWN